jgi:hypothetical protein
VHVIHRDELAGHEPREVEAQRGDVSVDGSTFQDEGASVVNPPPSPCDLFWLTSVLSRDSTAVLAMPPPAAEP